MCKVLIPSVDEGGYVLAELFHGEEVTVFEALAFEDAEPDLNHVEPGGVEGNEVNGDAFVP